MDADKEGNPGRGPYGDPLWLVSVAPQGPQPIKGGLYAEQGSLEQTRWMLLCCQGRFGELVVEVAGEVSLEGSHGLSFGLSFGDLALHV
ncbi:MAG: hypothetical protein WBV77_04460, partial [Solirubrobacteraceae bacterium]